MRTTEHVIHTIEPVYNSESRILILGSFPSVKSRETEFFYGHPRNRFWRVLADIFEEELPETVEEKKRFLLRNHIAVWDVIQECDIAGSSDSSIRNVIPTDLKRILHTAEIETIYVNGRTAETLFHRFQEQSTGRTAVVLPSTSPANAAWSPERLCEAWSVIRKDSDRNMEN